MEPVVRTLQDVTASRTLRAELLTVAAAVAQTPGRLGILRLVHPRISEQRLEQEWRSVLQVVRPTILSRLSVQVVLSDGRSRVFAARSGRHPKAWTAHAPPRRGLLLPARDLSFAVEKLLVWAWLTRKGPLTRTWVEQTVGCAYPTVAAVVKRLGSAVSRHRDRRIELRQLPREEWARLFALSGRARSVMRFVDRSGQRGTAAGLLRRLGKLAPSGVAVGGVAGTRHHYPELDLVGLPRLDLSVHAPDRDAHIGFISSLDPALKQTQDSAEPALVVLHFVRHREPLFVPHPGSLPWADPIECLLDLHEAGLETQALEFLDALASRGPRSR
jgi:hypothetical protein